MKNYMKTFLAGESGATAVEYAVMLALVIAIAFIGIELVGIETADLFGDSSTKIDSAFNN